jgi:hypothetical protein
MNLTTRARERTPAARERTTRATAARARIMVGTSG